MDDNKKKSSFFGLGVLLGTILGGLTAFFLSPKSGSENRKMVGKRLHELEVKLEEADLPGKVTEIYGNVSEEGKEVYKKVRKEVVQRLHEWHERMEEVDTEKYKKMVAGVVSEVKEDTVTTGEKLQKIGESFLSDWNKIFGEAPTKSKKS